MSNQLKNHIISLFRLNGFSLRGEACDFLLANLEPLPGDDRNVWLEKITDWLLKENLTSPVIEKKQLEAAIIECCKVSSEDDDNLLTVYSAFNVPRFYFDITRKKFLPSANKQCPELFSSPQEKGAIYRCRYTVLQQKTLRNKLFRSTTQGNSQFRLCTIDSLLSVTSSVNNIIVLGMIAQLKEEKYYLEDPTGIVPLDLAETIYHDGLFAETCFVLVEGCYRDGILFVKAIGLPPREPSDVSRIYFGSPNSFGGPLDLHIRNNRKLLNIEKRRTDSMFVFISDIWLDQPKVLEKLEMLFDGYSQTPPTAFILMGNFLSGQKGSQHFSALRSGFRSLGDIISQYSELANNSKFILVPGPIDLPNANILPRPEFPDTLVAELKNRLKHLTLASNPCRIRYCTQEIVLIRENILTKLCRNSIHFPETKDIPLHFVKTIICQSHLAPLSLNVCPLYWGYDAALQLYPCPDMIVVGEQQKPFSVCYNDCNVINPGSFSKGEFTFKVYYPATKEIDECQIPVNVQ
ncbi:hypothetical protein AAG570_013127 [Ranatra chinensis]|uniref:DNA polymerase epsilon subunit n=1 Tax=Ranatra chinensis TaxID=642074 RepID=A0ABD0YHT3_9HEMI